MKLPLEMVGFTDDDLEYNGLALIGGGGDKQVSPDTLMVELGTVDRVSQHSSEQSLVLNSIAARLTDIGLAADKLGFESEEARDKLEASKSNLSAIDLASLNLIVAELSKVTSHIYLLNSTISDLALSYRMDYAKLVDAQFVRDRLLTKIVKYEQMFKTESDNLNELNSSLEYSRAFAAYYDRQTLDSLMTSNEENLGAVMEIIPPIKNILSQMQNETAIYLELVIESSNQLLFSLQCYYRNLKGLLEKLVQMFDALFDKAYTKWLRIFSGSYLREGENVAFSRDCGTVTVHAIRPELEPCDPITYMHQPPLEFVMLNGPPNICPPCEPQEPPPEDNPNSLLCNQNPTETVYERKGGQEANAAYKGYVLHVQPNLHKADGNTKYLMMSHWTVPQSGNYEFTVASDDDFELYLDCVQVATGKYGMSKFNLDLTAGTKQIILRYENIPHNTEGYVGLTATLNGEKIYETRAADFKGQANHIGEIEYVKP